MKRNTINGNIDFKEVQKMPGSMVWIMIGVFLLSIVGLALALGQKQYGVKAEEWVVIGIMVPFESAVVYIASRIRFESFVTVEGIYYRWMPFFKKYTILPWQEIESVKVRKSPFMQYGYKIVPGYGRVHNLSQGKGLQILLKSGRKYFIGSQKMSGFQRAVERNVPVSAK